MINQLLKHSVYPLIEEKLKTVKTLGVERSKYPDLLQLPSNEDIKDMLMKKILGEEN